MFLLYFIIGIIFSHFVLHDEIEDMYEVCKFENKYEYLIIYFIFGYIWIFVLLFKFLHRDK